MKLTKTIALCTFILSAPAMAMTLDPIPAGKEKCYGIADAGQNDGPFMADYPEAAQGAGGSKYPCERTAWRWVPKGKCINIMIGFTADGTALTGTLTPRAENVNPVKCLPYTHFGDEDDNAQSPPSNMSPNPMPSQEAPAGPQAGG